MVATPPAAVLTALANAFDVDASALTPLAAGGAPDGTVYPTVRAGIEAFFKLRLIREELVAAEHDHVAFMEYLGSNGIRTPELLLSTNGSTSEQVPDPDGQGVWLATLLAKLPGRHLEIPQDWSDDLVRLWGATVGQMHAATDGWDGGGDLPDWREERAMFLEMCEDEELTAVWRLLGQRMDELASRPGAVHPIHNDLHLGNFLYEDGALGVLDFDVAGRHVYAVDYGTVLVHPLWEMRNAPGAGAHFIETWMTAYQEHHAIDDAWLDQPETYLRYRMCLFVTAMQHEGAPASWLKPMRDWVLAEEVLPGTPGRRTS